MLNKIDIMGRLAGTPELKHTAGGDLVCTFTVSCHRDHIKDDSAEKEDYVDFVAWHGKAEYICRNFKKGMLVVITGRLLTRTRDDDGGNHRRTCEVLVSSIYSAEKEDDPRATKED